VWKATGSVEGRQELASEKAPFVIVIRARTAAGCTLNGRPRIYLGNGRLEEFITLSPNRRKRHAFQKYAGPGTPGNHDRRFR